MNKFDLAIIEKRKPLVGVTQELKMTVGGIVDQGSAFEDGDQMKAPQCRYWTYLILKILL